MTSTEARGLPQSDAARDLLASKLRGNNASRDGSVASGSRAGPSSAATEKLEEARRALLAGHLSTNSTTTSGSSEPSQTREGDLLRRTPAQDAAVEAGDERQGPVETASQESKPTATPLPPLEQLAPPVPLTASQLQETTFKRPRKRIVSPASLQRWEASQAFDEVLGFVMHCNNAVVGRKLTDDLEQSAAVRAIVSILDTVDDIVKQTPAEKDSTSRFGNAAFRTFYARVRDQSRALHNTIPGLDMLKGRDVAGAEKDGDSAQAQACDAIGEIETYFIESFGSEKRIDYGSGMELNFACWLLCLVKLGILDLEKEAPALVLCVFWRYVEVMRNVQSTYWLEPAGSHGVWGLDDYHFLPFLYGSAQLKGHKYFKPKSIHDQEVLDEFGKDYMYFACIRFINSIKTASLRWHSPMLDDISGVKTWAKVNEGMLKMYRAEVLLKLPIAQHIFFGTLISFGTGASDDEGEDALADAVAHGGIVHEDGQGHVHVHGGEAGQGAAASASGWGDCCGIPIPSVFAAAQEEQSKLKGAGGLRFEGGSGLRRVPFD